MAPSTTEEVPTTKTRERQHDAFAALEEMYERVPIDNVVPSQTNPRTHFDEAYISQLALSVAEKGVIEPLLVRPFKAKKEGIVEVVAGECRYRAARRAGLTHLPCIIRPLTNEQALEHQLIENLHRRDLTPLEEAAGYRALIKANPDKHNVSTLAERIGKSKSWVWDLMKLLDLIPEARQLLEEGRIAVGHAIPIARLKPEDQKRVIDPEDGGLFEYDEAGLDWDEDDPANAKRKPGKFDALKSVSVRELEHYIADHVRFDVQHAAKAAPLAFEPVAQAVDAASAIPGRGKKVIPITFASHVQEDARDDNERTYSQQSWRRADGTDGAKTCDHSVLGVVAAGSEHYGEAFEVCVARDKCGVHFGDVIRAKEKAATLRARGDGKNAAKVEKKAAESAHAKWEREQADRSARQNAWAKLEPLIFAEAVAQVRSIKTLTAAHGDALLKLGGELGTQQIKKHLGANWFKNPAAALLVSAVTDFGFNSYGPGSGFESYVKRVAKPFRLDLKRLNAVRAQAEPPQTSGVKKGAKK